MATPSKKKAATKKSASKKRVSKKTGTAKKAQNAKYQKPSNNSTSTVIQPESIAQQQNLNDTKVNNIEGNANIEITSTGDLKSQNASVVGKASTTTDSNSALKLTPETATISANQFEDSDSQSVQIKSSKNSSKKNSTARFDSSDHAQIIQSKVERIFSLHKGTEDRFINYILFRSSMRAFPFAVKDILPRQSETIDLKNILILWRAVLHMWFIESFQSKSSTYRDSIKFIADKHKGSKAIASILSAIIVNENNTLAAPIHDISESLINAADSSSSHATDMAYSEDPGDAGQSAFETVYEEINFDLDWILDSANNKEELIKKPLWNIKNEAPSIFREDWQPLLKKLSEDENKNELAEISKQLLQDYTSILTGIWDSNELKTTLARQTADEQTQDDLPSSIDYLGRDQLVNALVPRLSQKKDSHHLTIGLLGNWGIGKSSVIHQLQLKLQSNVSSHNEYFFGEFNAWSYEHTPNLQAGIAQEAIKALTNPIKIWGKWKQRVHQPTVLWKFAVKLHGLRILGALTLFFLTIIAGLNAFSGDSGIQSSVMGASTLGLLLLFFHELKTISAQPLANKLKTYLRLPSYHEHLGTIPVMEKDIHALCEICLGEKEEDISRRLIFFIDDLDRCNEEGIVKTFEAIRLVLNIPWVTVIIAMDHRIALPALACHFEKMSKYHRLDPMSIARDYLAKVVHLPIRLSAPDNLSVASYLAHIWDDQNFLETIKAELVEKNTNTVSPSDLEEEQIENPVDTKLTDTAPAESLGMIIKDIQKINIRERLAPVKKSDAQDNKPEETNETQGFGPEQKKEFYNWLVNFNLRNPRQIKRLYNSYHLLWSFKKSNWEINEDAWYPNMLALFIFEMINEHIPFNGREDIRRKFRDNFFNSSSKTDDFSIEGIKQEKIEEARQIILNFQTTKHVNFVSSVEPFILPAISPQDLN